MLGLSRGRLAASDAPVMPVAEGPQRRRQGRRGGRRQPRDAAGRHGAYVAKVVLWTVFFIIFRHLNHFY